MWLRQLAVATLKDRVIGGVYPPGCFILESLHWGKTLLNPNNKGKVGNFLCDSAHQINKIGENMRGAPRKKKSRSGLRSRD